jgi:predicted ATP-dependent endonuclease of OLD family
MILNIEGLGIIKQAQIDLNKKLILFCGRNGTGKTYASYVLQAFLQDGYPFNLDCFGIILDELKEKGCFVVKKEYITQWLTANCLSVKNQLGSIFGISDTTVSKLFSRFSLEAIYSGEDYEMFLNSTINVQMTEGSLYWKISKPADSDAIAIESNVTFSDMRQPSFRLSTLLSSTLRMAAFCNRSDARMLTVERNSIYTFKTELSLSRNELIDQIQQSGKSEIDVIGIINNSSRRYPQAVRNSLRIANDLETISKNESEFAGVATMIEQNLLLGEVSMTKNGDVEFCGQGMAKSRKLPFHLSSSIVKTMASLVIYLRHLARVGDTLIVDEPEMNFHPDVQILLARIFAILTTKGLHVVISTHSDYIIREINNLIMAGSLNACGNQPLLENMGYTSDMLLDYNELSVLCFERTGKAAVKVKRLEVDDEGFAMKSMDEAILNQNLNAERLYALLSDN